MTTYLVVTFILFGFLAMGATEKKNFDVFVITSILTVWALMLLLERLGESV